jgi:hypothetical protein
MAAQAISGLNLVECSSIVLAALKSDIDEYNLRDGLYRAFSEFNIPFTLYELDVNTTSQSETVAITIDSLAISGNIFIKDCDCYIKVDNIVPDSVCVYSLQNVNEIDAKSKSYVDVDDYGFVKTIVEKQVIGELFCCGGYSFSDAEKFVHTYNRISNSVEEEIYVSHVIHQQLLDGDKFGTTISEDFLDWGTLSDWDKYKEQYKTFFVDLDGVLVKNSSEYFEPLWGDTNPIQANIDVINSLYETGKVRIIITTARKSSAKNTTLVQLRKCGIRYHDIIFDLLHCERVVINDYSKTNKYPSCSAVNLIRNSDALKDILK